MVPPPEASLALQRSPLDDPTIAETVRETNLLNFETHLPGLLGAIATKRDSSVFPDGKMIVDGIPKMPVIDIVANWAQYRKEASPDPRVTALDFYFRHFDKPNYEIEPINEGDKKLTVEEYSRLLRDRLIYHQPYNQGTLIGSKEPSIKPGLRFGEAYYRDTAVEVAASLVEARQATSPHERRERERFAKGLVDNIKDEIEEHGHPRNAKRTYYDSRSQTPVFVLMVKMLDSYFNDPRQPEAERRPNLIKEEYRDPVKKELAWWMDPRNGRVMRMPDGSLLNRHFNYRTTPREESWQEDYEVAMRARILGRPLVDSFTELGSGAEHGNDFAPRHTPTGRLEEYRVTKMVTTELNSLMREGEQMVAENTDDPAEAREFRDRVRARDEAMNKYMWNPKGFYSDYDWELGKVSDIRHAGMADPVIAGVANGTERARLQIPALRSLLRNWGFVSTDVEVEGLQWGAPNGWITEQIKCIKAAIISGDPQTAYWGGFRWMRGTQILHDETGNVPESIKVTGEKPEIGTNGEYEKPSYLMWTPRGYVVIKSWIKGQVELPYVS